VRKTVLKIEPQRREGGAKLAKPSLRTLRKTLAFLCGLCFYVFPILKTKSMFSITPSHLLEYLYCPRFTYFEYVLRIPQNEDKYFKVNKGRDVHQQKAKQNVGYLRKRIGVVEMWDNQYLTNELLRGEVDEVLRLKDGTFAPLDYKFAEYKDRVFDTYKTQLYCYAWLIESNFQASVQKGYLIYTRSKNYLVELPITPKDIDKVKRDAEQIRTILATSKYPKSTKYKKRCLSCTYRNICTK
jgi:CRISPR-associated exonuclease Cas4